MMTAISEDNLCAVITKASLAMLAVRATKKASVWMPFLLRSRKRVVFKSIPHSSPRKNYSFDSCITTSLEGSLSTNSPADILTTVLAT